MCIANVRYLRIFNLRYAQYNYILQGLNSNLAGINTPWHWLGYITLVVIMIIIDNSGWIGLLCVDPKHNLAAVRCYLQKGKL